MASAPLLFAVDRMLGRLAAWLRLIGHDATCGPHLTGRTLIRHARNQGRIILTRDRQLLREQNSPSLLFIESDHFRDQLRQVVATYQLDPFAHIFTRCSRCNQPVVPISKEQVRKQVPAYVFTTEEHFVCCPRCRRIYWPATHYERVRDELRRIGFHPPE
jgi:uncharacterized protein with PIN domain